MSTAPLLQCYGEWTVIGTPFNVNASGIYKVRCRCSCGTEADVRADYLRTNRSKGCKGCLWRRRTSCSAMLAGERFGRLLTLAAPRSENGVLLVACKCDCGEVVDVQPQHLRSGRNQQCNVCRLSQKARRWKLDELSPQQRAKRIIRHLQVVYYGAWRRCHVPSAHAFKDYGGRGIHLAPEWVDRPQLFVSWALQQPHHDDPFYTLDRLDNEKGYSPDNCRFATREEQSSNMRRNVFVEYNGERLTVSQFLRKYCPWCSPSTGTQYLRKHSPAEAIARYRPVPGVVDQPEIPPTGDALQLEG